MAIYTQLSVIGTPGKRYSFLAKAAAEAAERPEGTFTALSVLGVPGIIHSFSAKGAVEAGVKGEGEFTALSVLALPGVIHSFSAKGVLARRPKRSKEKTWLAWQAEDERVSRLRREDNELLEIIGTMITRGMLN